MVFNRKYTTIMKLVKQGIMMSANAGTPTYIEIVNSSLDIEIANVYIGATLMQIWSGLLPNTTGNGTTLKVPLGVTIPDYYDITIYYGASSTGQKITFTDSNSSYNCQDTNVGNNTITFYGVYVNNTTYCIISAEDGTC
jgi:hypothetical protein